MPTSLPRRQHVVEIAEVVADADEVEDAEQAAEGDAHAVGAAGAAELPASFDVRLEFEEHARNATPFEALLERRNRFAEVAEDGVVGALPHVGGHKMLEALFVRMLFLPPLARLAVSIDWQ